jgi:Protein of unknown function (DUF3147)
MHPGEGWLRACAMSEFLARFLIGGVVVSVFSLFGDILKPKTFAGLFSAAPSVALATLSLAIATQGHEYAALESRSMIAGAIAFLAYAVCANLALMRLKVSTALVTLALLPLWCGIALFIWYGWLR